MFCTECGKQTEDENELCSSCLPEAVELQSSEIENHNPAPLISDTVVDTTMIPKKSKSLIPTVILLGIVATALTAGTLYLHLINDDVAPSPYGVYTASEIIENSDGLYALETNSHDEIITIVDNGKYLIETDLVSESGNSLTNTDSSDYIFAASNTRYLTEDEVMAVSAADRRIARNEIYARHGRQFNDAELQSYFDSKSWYSAKYSASDFDALGNSLFNNYEITNLELLSSID